MKLRNIFLANTAVSLLFALGLLLMPAVLLDIFGFTINDGAKLLGQFVGVELLVGGLITFFAKDSRDINTRQMITLSNLIATVIGVIVALGGTLSGAMNSSGWVIVVMYLLLALGFGYFQFFGPVE
ncbi:MAG: hypothetical protein QGM50_07075 [Anaerolineae bacterium]|nr:hypothetical protein [Anaerolineae bacterium]MDK1080297.1 hypothetical protein [Anaerolineae bacterium]MDK1118539.1 hypothetical protein [Anaerolineae bacterium]